MRSPSFDISYFGGGKGEREEILVRDFTVKELGLVQPPFVENSREKGKNH